MNETYFRMRRLTRFTKFDKILLIAFVVIYVIFNVFYIIAVRREGANGRQYRKSIFKSVTIDGSIINIEKVNNDICYINFWVSGYSNDYNR